jgi:hypothetical protein
MISVHHNMVYSDLLNTMVSIHHSMAALIVREAIRNSDLHKVYSARKVACNSDLAAYCSARQSRPAMATQRRRFRKSANNGKGVPDKKSPLGAFASGDFILGVFACGLNPLESNEGLYRIVV